MARPKAKKSAAGLKTIFVVPTGNYGGEAWIRGRLDEVGLDHAADMYEATLIILPGGDRFLDRVPEELRGKAVVILEHDPNREETARTRDVLEIKNNGFRDVYLGHLEANALIRWVVTHLNGRFPKSSV